MKLGDFARKWKISCMRKIAKNDIQIKIFHPAFPKKSRIISSVFEITSKRENIYF